MNQQLALITGASQGIGFELAKVFARNGFDLIICSDSNKITEAAGDLKNLGSDVTAVQCDLATREGVDELYEKAKSLGRSLDVAVLNAGVGISGEFCEVDYEKELNVMNLNIVNTVYLAKKVIQDMIARDEGRILFTSSIAGEMPGPYYAVYAASKAFIQSFAQAVRFEMNDTGKNVTITSLQPGATDTNFFHRAEMEDTPAGKGKKDDPAEVAQQGYDALMKGLDHVVAGSIKNKLQAFASNLMSEPLGSRAHASDTRPEHLK